MSGSHVTSIWHHSPDTVSGSRFNKFNYFCDTFFHLFFLKLCVVCLNLNKLNRLNKLDKLNKLKRHFLDAHDRQVQWLGKIYYVHQILFNNLIKDMIGPELKRPDLVGIVDRLSVSITGVVTTGGQKRGYRHIC